MATVTAPSPGARTPGSGLSDTEPRLPDRLAGIPAWVWVGGGLTLLMAISAFLRTRYIGGEFWMDEGITTGISLHPISQIPGILRYDGNPPLYYMMLHVWMSVFGTSETATHALSLVVRPAHHPRRRLGRLEAVRVAHRGVRRGAVRLQRLADRVRPGDPDVRVHGAARGAGHRGLPAGLRPSPAPLPVPVRRGAHGHALHAHVGDVLLRRLGGGPDPGAHRLRRSPRPHPRRRLCLRRRRHPLPALGPDAALPGRQHRGALGQRAPVRRPDPALA